MLNKKENIKIESTLIGNHLKEKQDYENYLLNFLGFKDLIVRYTIADLKSMIYATPNTSSGGCGYPAVQILISLMEIMGELIDSNIKTQCAFTVIFEKLGKKYNKNGLAGTVYNLYRHGIAHASLAKGGVLVSKDGVENFHLAKGGHQLDIKIMFEDFLKFFDGFFEDMEDKKKYCYYKINLQKIFVELNIEWKSGTQLLKKFHDSVTKGVQAQSLASTSTIRFVPPSGSSITHFAVSSTEILPDNHD